MMPMSMLLSGALPVRCRRLFLRQHEVMVRIGAHAFEKQVSQRVVFNVDLYVALAASTPQHDALDEVVDYDFIRTQITARIARGHIQLQETLCDDLLAVFLAHPGVVAARVSTEKPDVYPDCEAVSCEVFGINRAPATPQIGSQVVSVGEGTLS